MQRGRRSQERDKHHAKNGIFQIAMLTHGRFAFAAPTEARFPATAKDAM